MQERLAHETRCRWLLDQLTAAGGAVALCGDATYPARVRQRLTPPPVVLYSYGAPPLLATPLLAVLNSRTISEHSVAASLAVVQAAAAQGFTLVTGGMKTGYRIAAVAGRAAAAPRVVVLDRGILVDVRGTHGSRSVRFRSRAAARSIRSVRWCCHPFG